MSNFAVLKAVSKETNPEGLEAGFPQDVRLCKGALPDELAQLGYVLMSEKEFADYQKSIEVQLDAWRVEKASAQRLSNEQKIDGLDRLFDKCDATAAIWQSATRSQKDEFIEDFYKIIRRQKRQILDQYRPE